MAFKIAKVGLQFCQIVNKLEKNAKNYKNKQKPKFCQTWSHCSIKLVQTWIRIQVIGMGGEHADH